jgi:hypothetical protein
VRARVTTPEDRREELAQAVVAGGLGLRELRARSASLEDVFIALTTEEPE